MPTITDDDAEPCSMRFKRAGSEDMPAVSLVLGQMSQDPTKRCLPALADVMFSVVSISEGA